MSRATPFALERVDLAIILLLAGVTVLAFHGILAHPFINYDDPLYVTQNAVTQQGLTPRTLAWALTTSHAANWHPLTWLSIMLDVEWFGLDARGHHATSLLLHAMSVCLFYLVTYRMTGARWASALAAAFFAWHPLRVEVVAWVSQRKDVLSMLCALLALLGYEAYARKPGAIRMAGVAAALAAGLMAKPVLVTLPFALLLVDYWPLRRITSPAWLDASSEDGPADDRYARSSFGRLVVEKCPLFLIVALSCAITMLAQVSGGALNERISFGARLLNAGLAYVRYLWKSGWPDRLSIHYPYPQVFDLPVVVFAFLVVGLTSWIAFRDRAARPYFFTGWFWFLGTLVPVIGIVQVGSQSMADSYTYLPALGLSWIVAFGLRDWVVGRRVTQRAVVIGSIAVLAALCIATMRQVSYWQSTEKLFRRAIVLDPHNLVAQSNLSSFLIDRGQHAEARALLTEAIASNPDVADLYVNLGTLDARENRHESSLENFGKAMLLAPDNIGAEVNYGIAAAELGRYDLAVTHLERAVARGGGGNVTLLLSAHRTLAGVRRRQGDMAEADRQAQQAAAIERALGAK